MTVLDNKELVDLKEVINGYETEYKTASTEARKDLLVGCIRSQCARDDEGGAR